MAAWGFTCENCDKEFAQIRIEDTLESYCLPAKPDFPKRGKEFECPNCGYKATYQRTDLAYMTRRLGSIPPFFELVKMILKESEA